MKKYLSLILALCLPALLGGCGAVPLPMPESPTPPPAADTEEITYEVSTDPYEQTVTAEDGTTLMVIDFQIPHLQAYANGALIEDPSTPAQEQAMDRVHTFNENFDQWRESNSSEENISFVKDLYRDMPEMFSEDHMAPLSEELTYTCYRTGTLISIAADYYSYLGGAHPNTVYFAWNYDLDSGMFLTISELAADPQTFTLAVADMIEVQAEEQIASTPELEGQSLSDVYWIITGRLWRNGAATTPPPLMRTVDGDLLRLRAGLLRQRPAGVPFPLRRAGQLLERQRPGGTGSGLMFSQP